MTNSSPRGCDWRDYLVARLVEAKGDTTVSVCIPARDEEATIAGVVSPVVSLVGSLVEEIVVVDDGSTDGTGTAAVAAGARVVPVDSVLVDEVWSTGKGEALWKGLAATTGDLVVFLDGDLQDPHPGFVTGLLGPLLSSADTALVKATYDRQGGGRVTELVARPILRLLFPHLSSIAQPLVGEFAARREVLEALPFAPGYGVDVGLLIDVAERCGIEAIAQVDLGIRRHRNRPLDELGLQAEEVLRAAFARAGIRVAGSASAPPDRPPLCDLASYRASRIGARPL